MCGIVGIFRQTAEARPIDPARLSVMRDSMAHRGPDGFGQWIDVGGVIGLGHRRLSIIDLDQRANQPMVHPDGSLALTFNGEIYNYREVRKELQMAGVSGWQTTSDTEVLLKAYEYWGIACLSRMRGMFAFALWDGRDRALWLVRDRIGIKPLYYTSAGGRLAFASEIKALLMDPQQQRAMDEESLFHFISLMTTPAPRTMFKGIHKLPGGCWLRAELGGKVEIRRYWDALDEAQMAVANLPKDDGEIIEAIREELRTAVTYRGVADVPVGVFLSGGIDSSTNAALFSNTQSRAIKTFSIGYDGKHLTYRDELSFAKQMADRISADHHYQRLKIDELLDLLPHIIYLQDEPIADPVCFPVYCVSALARRSGITVAQIGEGADELFAGYPGWHRILRMRAITKRFGIAGSAMAHLGLSLAGKGDGILAETIRRGNTGEPFFWSGAEIFPGPRKERLLSSGLTERFRDRRSSESITETYGRFLDKAPEVSALNWMTYVDLNLRLPELLLMRVDKMSMGVSLECREPFLDHKLVGLALAIPTATKLAGNTPKSLLKRAVRGLIPDELIDRPKQGFGVPIQDWFLDRLGPIVQKEIQAFVRETDVLNQTEINRLFSTNDGAHLWPLYNLAAWHRQFIREWPHRNKTPVADG